MESFGKISYLHKVTKVDMKNFTLISLSNSRARPTISSVCIRRTSSSISLKNNKTYFKQVVKCFQDDQGD